jgi:Cu2+-exporting ATPase
MVTGDSEAPAQAAASEAGIDEVIARAFPGDKANVVLKLKESGHTVAVVGDGINDSPALAHADVAISLIGAADVARERAGVVLTDDDLHSLNEAIDIARNGIGLVQQNLFLVAVPNTIGLVLGAVGIIGPGIATVLNNGSAVLAALNSLRPLVADGALPIAELL